ncbi:MAG: hypothetical protein AAFX80_22605 [Cyanobacteria bacterium J06639_18]
MMRHTILVGLMGAFGMFASAGSALAQITPADLGVTFLGKVPLSCEFQNDSGNKITTLDLEDSDYENLERLTDEKSVKLICTTSTAQLTWTNLQADKDGQPLSDDTRAVLSASSTNLTSSPIRIIIRGTNVNDTDSSGIIDNSGKPIDEEIKLEGRINPTQASGQKNLLAGTYRVKATLTATPQ